MTTDEQIGRNVAAVRGELSQKDLAAKMRERGWKWSQATVWSIEKGERPLRLAEAEDLAEVLGVFSHEFVRDEKTATLARTMRQVSDLHHQFESLIQDYRMALATLAWTADDMPDISVNEAESVESWLSETPERMMTDLVAKGQIMARAEAELERIDSTWDDETTERIHREIQERKGYFTLLFDRYSNAELPPDFGIDQLDPQRVISEGWRANHAVPQSVVDRMFDEIVSPDEVAARG